MQSTFKILGIKIYKTERDYDDLVEEWRSLHINTAYVGVNLLVDQAFRHAVRKSEIRLFVIYPFFYDKYALRADPDLFAVTNTGGRAEEEWVKFVCPSRNSFVEGKIDGILRLMREFRPDGISLDFIRHFVFWEKIYPDRLPESILTTCFDEHCVASFQEAINLEIPVDTVEVNQLAKWILQNHQKEWVDWRCSQITSTVAKVHNLVRNSFPDSTINLHAVPWRGSDFGGAMRIVAGQDISELSNYVDSISPMCYAHMLKRGPEWVSSVVADFASQSRSKILPSIQVKEHYLNRRLTTDVFRASIDEALQPPSDGVIYWSWEALEQEPEKKELIRSLSD